MSYEEQSKDILCFAKLIKEVACCPSSESPLKVKVEYVAEGHMKPITDEVIEEVTQRIVAELDPEEIVLFGSYAWGTPHKYSDLDLCIIVSDNIPGFNRIEWGVRALNALNDLMVDVDVLVITRSVIDTFKAVPASLQRKIVEEGKLLYGQSKKCASKVLAQESAA